MNLISFIAFCLCALTSSLSAQQNTLTPDNGLQRLIEGNRRFMKDSSNCADRDKERRAALTATQEPFATILGCADSRVSPEIVFDQGVGDLFVVRVAGNVLGPVELDSIEYSVVYLHSSIIVVLGHENCGAIKAVLAGQTADIEDVARLITPSIQNVKNKPGNQLENAIRANVAGITNQLKNAPVLGRYIQQNKLKVVGGYYHLESGEVEILQ